MKNNVTTSLEQLYNADSQLPHAGHRVSPTVSFYSRWL